jgi:quercetin dioxygenase-like cupin family protein
LAPLDLVHVPPLAWHQFRADADAPLGFLCMVNATRDRPQLPDDEALARLRDNPVVAAFIAI